MASTKRRRSGSQANTASGASPLSAQQAVEQSEQCGRQAIAANGGSQDVIVEKITGSLNRRRKPLQQPIVRPLLPDLLKTDNESAEKQRRREAELQRASSSSTALEVRERLRRLRGPYAQAYIALNEELVNAQVEEALARNVKAAAKDARDRLRSGQ
ncbi:hypothetical protein ACM66B_006714 [Microbotryomycetes sp. NB124-2]